MTDFQYLVVALAILAIGMTLFNKVRAASKERETPAPTPPIVRLIEAEPMKPLDPAQLAGLFHQAVVAEGQTRAIRRGVESMIEDQSKKVQLPWASPSPPASPVPNP
jgi:hypothetical protein